MSHSIKVDAGLMREHKAHDLIIQDGPEPPRISWKALFWGVLGGSALGIGIAKLWLVWFGK